MDPSLSLYTPLIDGSRKQLAENVADAKATCRQSDPLDSCNFTRPHSDAPKDLSPNKSCRNSTLLHESNSIFTESGRFSHETTIQRASPAEHVSIHITEPSAPTQNGSMRLEREFAPTSLANTVKEKLLKPRVAFKSFDNRRPEVPKLRGLGDGDTETGRPLLGSVSSDDSKSDDDFPDSNGTSKKRRDLSEGRGQRDTPQTQLGTQYLKDVPVVLGVPTTPLYFHINWLFFISTFCFSWAFALGMWSLLKSYTLNMTVDLPPGANVTLALKNCATSFIPSLDGTDKFHVKAWLPKTDSFAGNVTASNVFEWRTPTDLYASLRMNDYNSYFQCVAEFQLSGGYIFDSLKIEYLPAESYVDVIAAVPIRAATRIHIKTYDAVVELDSVEGPQISLEIADGIIRYALDGPISSYNVTDAKALTVQSRSAPIIMESSIPLDITLSFATAARALVKGAEVVVNPDNSTQTALAIAYPSSSDNWPLTVSMTVVGEEVPLYMTARQQGTDMEKTLKIHQLHTSQTSFNAWGGMAQLEPPHLLLHHQRRLWHLSTWLEDYPGQPFLIVVSVLGDRVPEGKWRLLSSKAFLGRSSYFIIFSGGMLSPRRQRPKVHILGLFCRRSTEDEGYEDWGDGDDILSSVDWEFPTGTAGENTTTTIRRLRQEDSMSITSGTSETSSAFSARTLYKLPAPAATESYQRNGIHFSKYTTLFTPSPAPSRRRLSVIPKLKTVTYPGAYIGPLKPSATCQQDLLEDEYVVLWRAMNESFSASPTSTMVWAPSGKSYREIIYTVENDAILHHEAGYQDKSFFVVATFLNVSCSLVIAVILCTVFIDTMTTIYYAYFQKEVLVKYAASHRLDNEIISKLLSFLLLALCLCLLLDPAGGGWNVNVTELSAPCPALLIRWSAAGLVSFPRLAVQIRPIPLRSGVRNKLTKISKSTDDPGPPPPISASDEIFVYSSSNGVKTIETLSGLQKELEVPLRWPDARGKFPALDGGQRWIMTTEKKYRLRIMGLTASGRVARQSRWSAEFAIGGFGGLMDFLYILFRRYAPAKIRTLDYFMMKHVRQVAAFKYTIHIKSVELEIFNTHRPNPAAFLEAPATPHRRRDVASTSARSRSGVPQKAFQKEENSQRIGVSTLHKHKESAEFLSLTLSAYFTHARANFATAAAANDKNRLQRKKMIITGIPFPIEDSGDNSSQLNADPKAYIEVERVRASQGVLVFEIAETATSDLIAVGTVSMEDIDAVILTPDPTDSSKHYLTPEIRVRAERVRGGYQWGRISCIIDMSAIKSLLRHAPCQHTASAQTALTTARSRFISTPLERQSPQIIPQSDFSETSPLSQILHSRAFTGTVQRRKRTISILNPTGRLPLPPMLRSSRAPLFTHDFPGQFCSEGSDITIRWEWNTLDHPENIYLHLMDHQSEKYLHSLQYGRPVPNTGTFSWSIQTPFERGKYKRACYFAMSLEPFDFSKNTKVIAQSHAFYVVQTLPLSTLEMAYAAFCKSLFLEMEPMSEESLRSRGIEVTEKLIKICPDLRRPLPFEPNVPCIHTPGQCIVSTTSKLVHLKQSDVVLVMEDGGPSSRPITLVNVYKSVSRRIKVVEGCEIEDCPFWWIASADGILLKEGILYGGRFYEILNQYCGMIEDWIYAAFKKKAPVGPRIIEDAADEERRFERRRYFHTTLHASTLAGFFLIAKIAFLAYFPVQMLLALLVYNYVSVDFSEMQHTTVSTQFYVDILFAQSPLSFLLHIPSPFREIIIYALFAISFEVSLAILHRARMPSKLRDTLEVIGIIMEQIRTIVSFGVAASFLMWVLVGALINSDAFLPYGVMTGACLFSAYTLWNGYVSSRKNVSDFISANVDKLTSLALDKWFENSDIKFVDSPAAGGVAFCSGYAEQLLERLKAERNKARAAMLAEKADASDAGSVASAGAKEDHVKAHMKRNQLAMWTFEKVTAASLCALEFDEAGVPQGFESIRGLPLGSKLATCSEAERYNSAISSLLFGFETAMLADGVKYGPRFGYKLEKKPILNRKFTFAIAAIPRFPPPFAVPMEDKVAMIFDVFNRDADAWLNEIEFTLWQELLKKPMATNSARDACKNVLEKTEESSNSGTGLKTSLKPTTPSNAMATTAAPDPKFPPIERPLDIEAEWLATVQLYETTYKTRIDKEHGLSLTELQNYYRSTQAQSEINADYLRLFAVVKGDENGTGDDGLGSRSDDLFHGDDNSDDDRNDDAENDDDSAISDWSSDGAGGGADEAEDGEVAQKTDDLEELLATSENARKLKFIFDSMTKENCGWRVDALTSSVTYLAARIIEAQIFLLRPIFGDECLFGYPVHHTRPNLQLSSQFVLRYNQQLPQFVSPSPQPNRRRSTNAGRTSIIATTAASPEAAAGLAIPDSDATAEGGTPLFEDHARALHEETVADLNAQFRLMYTHMFDSSIVRLNVSQFYDSVIVSRIQMKAARLLNENIQVTAADVDAGTIEEFTSLPPKTMEQVMRFVRRWAVNNDAEIRRIRSMANLSPSHSKDVNVSLIVTVLLEAQILKPQEVVSNIVLSNDGLETFTLIMPRRVECYTVILRAMATTRAASTEDIIRSLCTNFLWFDAFRVLVRLLGISLTADELPGYAFLDDQSNRRPMGARGVGRNTSHQRRNIMRRVVGAVDAGLAGIIEEKVAAERAKEQKSRLQRNLKRIRQVFDQLSNNSSFLPVDLADEAVLLLTDNRMSFTSVVACLQHLKIHSPGATQRDSLTLALHSLGLSLDNPIRDIEAAAEEQAERLDWSEYRVRHGWDESLLSTFNRLTWASPGFMGKSQMIEFIREIHKFFVVDSPHSTVDGSPDRLVSFETMHRIAMRQQLSLSRRHSRILWALMCQAIYAEEQRQEATNEDAGIAAALPPEGDPIVLQFMPVSVCCRLLSDIYFQGVDINGYLTQNLFRRFVRQIGIDVSDKGLKAMWDDILKDPMDITAFVPEQLLTLSEEVVGVIQSKYLRLEMDNISLDPTKGKTISFTSFRTQLPKVFMTGLWPECIKVLTKLSLQADFTDSQLDGALDSIGNRLNKYGLARPEDVASIMTSLHVEGMSFPMLRAIVDRMQINMKATMLRHLFNLMDVNHDGSLDLGELITGFNVLFSRLLPEHVVTEVGVNVMDQLRAIFYSSFGLLSFFSFVGIAFTSFITVQNSGSTAMQSILALIGAVSLQVGTSDSTKLSERLRGKLHGIFGDELLDLLKKEVGAEESDKVGPKTNGPAAIGHHRDAGAPGDALTSSKKDKKPLRVRYLIPHKFRPDYDDPFPCVHFHAGDEVMLEPVVRFMGGGTALKQKLRWSITPKIPTRLRLIFETATGTLSGRIPVVHDRGYSAYRGLPQIFELMQQLPGQGQHLYATRASLLSPLSPLLLSTRSPDTAARLAALATAAALPRQSHTGSGGVPSPVSFPKTCFTITCRNTAGAAKTRFVFCISPQPRGSQEERRLPMAWPLEPTNTQSQQSADISDLPIETHIGRVTQETFLFGSDS